MGSILWHQNMPLLAWMSGIRLKAASVANCGSLAGNTAPPLQCEAAEPPTQLKLKECCEYIPLSTRMVFAKIRKLSQFVYLYNRNRTERPHSALGYRTPEEFIDNLERENTVAA